MKTYADFLEFAKNIALNKITNSKDYMRLLQLDDSDVFSILPGADYLRDSFCGKNIHLCAICNGKSGKCSEDCKFCSQSLFYKTDGPSYQLMDEDRLIEYGEKAAQTVINRYSIVTSGKKISTKEVAHTANAMAKINDIEKCVSLGNIGEIDFELLKKAGVKRYHHNLETSKSFFNQICTTHSYQERIDTILQAKKMGFSVCCGGIFGLGETYEDIFELAQTLKELDVESIPINFIVPVKGTPFENVSNLTPLRCLKIIAFFRYFFPDKEIIICGGRQANLKNLHPLIFFAGASAMMTGNYLTTTGQTLDDDLAMLKQLEFKVRPNRKET